MAQKLLGLTLIMQGKPANNLISCRNEGLSRAVASQGARKSRNTRLPAEPLRESFAAERLEAAGRLAAWLAHQINNPLGAISGNVQLLARRLQRDVDDPEALRSYLRHIEAIQSQIERCARITGDALNFTCPGEPDLRKVNAVEVIQEAIDLVRYMRPKARIAFDHGDDDFPAVRGDREWLVRVLFELLSNAAEASGESVVSVELEVVAGSRGRSSEIQVRISDSGPGIADDVLPRVFDPFFSTRDKARGLGLTLSLEMMRKMRGSIRVERSSDEGCMLTVGVPIWRRRS